MSEHQLKQIPSVAEIAREIPPDWGLPHPFAVRLIQAALEPFRDRARAGQLTADREQIVRQVLDVLSAERRPRLKNVINGTGVVLHTGLGRAPLHPRLLARLAERLAGYVNVELDLPAGERGERNEHVLPLLAALAGAEAGLVINNNAAAVLLALNTLAEGRQVVVSRGQLVEIGGSFRIPDVIAKSHCHLCEVGTTNRTHLRDYADAIGPDTALILWAHTSNYVVKGFTAQVALEDLVKLGHAHGLPVVADLGSGALIDLERCGLPPELQVAEVLKREVDLVTFSGDKLLGGPQAGLILGRAELIRRLQANPLYRALRCDKVTVALLEETIANYGGAELPADNLTLELFATPLAELRARGEHLLARLPEVLRAELGLSVVDSVTEAGSGSLPTAEIPSVALRCDPPRLKAEQLARRLRTGSDPVLGYIREGCFYIDLKAVLPEQYQRLERALRELD